MIAECLAFFGAVIVGAGAVLLLAVALDRLMEYL